MMRFNKMIINIQDAIIEFCIYNSSTNDYVNEKQIESIVKSAFDLIDKNKGACINIEKIYRYNIYAGEEFTDEILPIEIKKKDVLVERAIVLGSFSIDSYSSNVGENNYILRGYDVVYDIDSKKIELLYRIFTTTDDMTTVYRVKTDLYEDFCLIKFITSISSQIIVKLNQNIGVIGLRKEVA